MTTADENRREELLGRVREVFAGHEAERGTPEKPKKPGFIALAKAGKDVWNAWRVEWPEHQANFQGIDLLRWELFQFSGFVFGDHANFLSAVFGAGVSFNGASFGLRPDFAGATFDISASFDGAQFGHNASFRGAQFGRYISFIGAQFGEEVEFSGAQFGDRATFEGAQFGREAFFDGAQFGAETSFAALTDKQVACVWRSVCDDDEAAVQERIDWAEQLDLRSDAFESINFAGAHFNGGVSFQNRAFRGTTRFDPIKEPFAVPTAGGGWRTIEVGPTRFLGVPDFHGCTLHQDTVFDEESFENVPRTKEAAHAFRTLKLAMSKEQATREEQMFFRLEMETERQLKETPKAKRALLNLYEFFSDYGFGLRQPIFRVWVPIGFICAVLHLVLTIGYVIASGQPLPSIVQRLPQWATYSLINFAPLPGLDRVQTALRTTLFGNDGFFQLVAIFIEILHKTSALLAFFLVALALRNLFKMKG